MIGSRKSSNKPKYHTNTTQILKFKMQKIHLALAVTNLSESITDYTERLESEPCLVIQNQYALWRTELLNLSITQTHHEKAGFRHLGWEDDQAKGFTSSEDTNGITWEHFDFSSQIKAIEQKWPDEIDQARIDKLTETNTKANTSLETQLTQLASLVEKIQTQLPIDQALATYEEGTRLAIACEQSLATSEQKVRILTSQQGATEAFDLEDKSDT